MVSGQLQVLDAARDAISMSAKEIKAFRDIVKLMGRRKRAKRSDFTPKRLFKGRVRSVSRTRKAPPDSATWYHIGDEMEWTGTYWRVINSGVSKRWKKIKGPIKKRAHRLKEYIEAVVVG
jgi:hypothetical protein